MTQYHRIQYNAMHKFVRVLDKYAQEDFTQKLVYFGGEMHRLLGLF